MQFSKESNKHSSEEALPVIDGRLAELGEAAHAILSALEVMIPNLRAVDPGASANSANNNLAASRETTPSVVASAPVEPKPVVAEQPTSPAVTPITSAPSYRPPEASLPTDTVQIDSEGNFLASARRQINDAYDSGAA